MSDSYYARLRLYACHRLRQSDNPAAEFIVWMRRLVATDDADVNEVLALADGYRDSRDNDSTDGSGL